VNPFAFVMRRPIMTLTIVAGLVSGGVLALKKMGVDVLPALNASKVHDVLDYLGMGGEQKDQKEHKAGKEHGEQKEGEEESPGEQHKLVVTSPQAKDVVTSQPYVCQIHSKRHIEVRALEDGYIQEIFVSEGQAVKKGDVMFKVFPVIYQAKANAKIAEADLAQLEYNNTERLAKNNVVSQNELALLKAKLDRARAEAELAKAELNFTDVRAPFDGIVDRQHQQLGSLVDKGDILTTLSDNSVMWVYFNVREAAYLEYMASRDEHKDERVELVLANHAKYKYPSKNLVIEAKFNPETGNIPFRADFPNPDGLLRYGQTGTVLLPVVMKGAIVIPQRAVFEVLDKRYVYVVDKDNVVHLREVVTDHREMEDVFIITKGLGVNDKIVLEGSRQLRDGEKVEFEFRQPEQVMLALKNHAE
jgi:membrane fusion protein (multidrug efflux system)